MWAWTVHPTQLDTSVFVSLRWYFFLKDATFLIVLLYSTLVMLLFGRLWAIPFLMPEVLDVGAYGSIAFAQLWFRACSIDRLLGFYCKDANFCFVPHPLVSFYFKDYVPKGLTKLFIDCLLNVDWFGF